MMRRYTFLTIVMFVAWCSVARGQWEPVGEAGAAYAIAVQGDLLFSGLQGDSIYVSDDQGDTWTAANAGITNSSVWWLSSIDGTLYCGTQAGSAFRSTDNGVSWEDIGLLGVRGFVEHNDTLYVCRWYAGTVDWSVDEGGTWNPTAALSGSGGLWPMISHHGHLFVGGQGGGVFRIQHSTDTWQQMNTGLTGLNVYTFTVLNDVLYLGGTNGVWRSDDDGASWESTGLTGLTTYAVHAVGTRLFAGGDFGIRVSTDGGDNWSDFGTGLSSPLIARITNDADYLYAGGYVGGGVHRRPLVGTSGVEDGADAQARPFLFPMPAEDRVEVGWPSHVAINYRIRDLAGGLADEGAIRDGMIDIGHLPTGAYLLELTDVNAARAVLRLVRQ